jgi:hypothetical protein
MQFFVLSVHAYHNHNKGNKEKNGKEKLAGGKHICVALWLQKYNRNEK